MERIADKLVVLSCCVAPLALVGVNPQSVGMLLVALSCAFLAEVLPPRAAGALAATYFPVALALPVGVVFAALPAYELARRAPALLVLAALVPLAAGWSGALSPVVVVAALFACAASAALARRTDRTVADRAANRTRADELRERELALEARNRDLLDARDYEVRLATLSERARIAREIHDNVGHLLTRAVVQAEAYRVAHAGDPVEKDLAAVAGTVREALDEVRASVHDLRDDASDLAVQLRDEVGRACAGTRLSADVRAEASDAPAAVTSCLLAVAREAVSNVLRHSDARRVRVELVEHPGLWRLTVEDDGAAAGRPDGKAAREGSGMGLASMEERVRALGGTFRAGPGARGGWTVFASVPRCGEGARTSGGRSA